MTMKISDLADKYEKLLKSQRLHQNLISMLQAIIRQRKGEGSMDDIQSFEDVITRESTLIGSIKQEIEEIEDKIKQY